MSDESEGLDRSEKSPLTDPLARYREFLEAHRDFQGYVEFFLLQGLVSDDCSSVGFFLPFDDLTTSPLPESLEAYDEYRKLATAFIEARGKRMLQS